MSLALIESEIFQQRNFTEEALTLARYEDCQFINCQFNGVDLSKLSFSECTFSDCDLSMAKVNLTAFKMVAFQNCKILGVHFDHCHDFMLQFTFTDCLLDLSVFDGMNLKGQIFKACSLKEVSFVQTNLGEAQFEDCDLERAIFEYTLLEKADFRQAINYQIDPELNRLRGAKFSSAGLAGLLRKYDLEID